MNAIRLGVNIDHGQQLEMPAAAHTHHLSCGITGAEAGATASPFMSVKIDAISKIKMRSI